MPDAKYAYGLCRTVMGHAWHYQPEELVKHWRFPGYAFVFECEHCGTVKHVWYSTRGAILGTRYAYPDDYKTKEDRMAIRLHALTGLRPKGKCA